MTKNEFAAMCGDLLISPAVALENENIRQALKNGESAEVRDLLENEF